MSIIYYALNSFLYIIYYHYYLVNYIIHYGMLYIKNEKRKKMSDSDRGPKIQNRR